MGRITYPVDRGCRRSISYEVSQVHWCRLRILLQTWQKLRQRLWEGTKTKEHVLLRWRLGRECLRLWRPDRLLTAWSPFPSLCEGPSEQYLYDDFIRKERLLRLCWLRLYAHKYAFRHNEVRWGKNRKGNCVQKSAVWPKYSFIHEQPHTAARELGRDRLPVVWAAGRKRTF